MLNLVDLIKSFLSVGSVAGDESALAGHIAELARPCADGITTDRLGNLIIHKQGTGPRVMLCAHMDTTGLMVTHIDDKGFVRFANVGGLSPRDVMGAPVVFVGGARGVVCFEEKTELKDLKLSHGYIDIGADSRDKAAATVKVGDRARWAHQPFETGGTLVSPYLDDYAGCAILLQTLAHAEKTENDLYFVFSAQEEVGLRGARAAAFDIRPDWALAVDVTDTGDYPEPKRKNECRLGGGAAIKLMDTSVMCHPTVVRLLEDSARAAGIPYQYEVMEDGGTDAGAISLSRGGVPSGGVSIPTRYIHSPMEMAALADMEACAGLLAEAVKGTISV